MTTSYDHYLLDEVYTIVALLCILVPVTIVIACFGIRYLKNRKNGNAIACGLMVAILVAAGGLATFGYLIPYVSDVKNQSYIRYEGTFFVADAAYDLRAGSQPMVTFDNTTPPLADRFRVRGDTYLSDGSHEGYIIYSKRSKIIVEWHCNDCLP